MSKLFQVYHAIRNREEGQALVEYSLILALVSVVAVALLTQVGGEVNNTLTGVRDALIPGP